MRSWRSSIAGASVIVVACTIGAGVAAQTPPTQAPMVKAVDRVALASVDGKVNFDAYCGVCHGRAGKGDGRAAPAMKTLVPDLTAIAARRNGRFDALEIEYLIRSPRKNPGLTRIAAHGVDGMPTWGEVFSDEDATGKSRLRTQNLVKYLESIQVAPSTARR